jgi:hypothetical protein
MLCRAASALLLVLVACLLPAAQATASTANIAVGSSEYNSKDRTLTVSIKITATQNATFRADLHDRPGFTVQQPSKTMELLKGDKHTFTFTVTPSGSDEVQGTYKFLYDISADTIVIDSGEIHAELGTSSGHNQLGLPAPTAALVGLLLLGLAMVVRGRSH